MPERNAGQGRGLAAGSPARRAVLPALILALLLCGGLLVVAPPGLRAQAAQSDYPPEVFTGLTPVDFEAVADQMDALGRFFSAFAERDTNGFARERWRQLGVNYRGTATRLRDLLAQGDLIIDDLPPGRSSGLLDDGSIVIDSHLGGLWSRDTLLAATPSEAATLRRDFLLPVLMEALARRYASQDWQWLADHQRAVGELGELGREPLARPLLARFFQAKDAYLWLALQRIADGDPAVRQDLARRQAATFETIRGLRTDMAATFGAASADRLQQDWAAYVSRVDGFAATRGWVLLDPALKRTQVGAAAREEADAVDRAAAEMVAAAPRSAVAAAAAGLELAKQPAAAAEAPAKLPSVSLAAIVDAAGRPSLDQLAARLPLESLALRPEALAAPTDSAAFQTFAARVKEALAAPDPRQVIARQEAALSAAQAEVAALQARVGELDRGLAQRSAQAADLEVALAAERARLAAAEQRAAEQAATAASLSAEVEELEALRSRVQELDDALAARAEQAETLESSLAAERGRLAAAERRAAEQSAAAESLSGEVAELSSLRQRLEELDAALAARNEEAEALATALAAERQRLAESEQRRAEALAAAEAAPVAAAAAAPADPELEAAAAPPAAPGTDRPAAAPAAAQAEDLVSVLSRIEQRQLYMMGAIAVILLLALLLWLRSRRRLAVVTEPPLLLTASAALSEPKPPADEARAARPVIDVEAAAEAAPAGEAESAPPAGGEPAPAAAPRLKSEGERQRVYGMTPETREAQAAVKAGSARIEAARAASLGSESDAAGHPIVRALRKGNLPLFELLFSELTGLRSPQLQRIVYGGRGEDLAIVCRAVEIDKLLFGSIYLLTDTFRGGDADENSERTAEILRLYDRMSPAIAKKVLAKWQRNWGEEILRPEESSLV